MSDPRRYEYTVLPGDVERPLVDVTVGAAGVRTKGLFDTGAVHTIFPEWVAGAAEIVLDGIEPRPLAVGNTGLSTRFTTIGISAAGLTWEAEVGFAREWPEFWGLLGHRAFHRYFTAIVEAADLRLTLIPIER